MRRPAIFLVAALLLGAAAVADVVRPARRPAEPVVAGSRPGGVWGCPFVSAGSGSAWVHLVNVADAPSRIRLTVLPDGAAPIVRNVNLVGRRAVSVPVRTPRRAAAAIVEFAGGDVYASRTAVVDDVAGKRLGGVGGVCSRATTGLVALPAGTTLGGETTLHILNTASSDATIDVSILTRDDDIRPERLQGFIVPPRGRRAIRIGDYAFDEGAARAVVRVRAGSVVADGLIVTSRGVSLVPGQVPAPSVIGIATAERGAGLIDVLAPGDDDVVLDASLMTPALRTAFTQPIENGLEGSVPASFGIQTGRPPAVAATMSVREGGPIVAAMRWHAGTFAGTKRRSDITASTGLVAARRLVAVSGAPADGVETKILLANPGEDAATVTLTVLRGTNPVVLGVHTVEPGRVLQVNAGNSVGALGIAAEADYPVAMLLTGLVPLPRFFASFTIAGLPVLAPAPVSVAIEPRLGIPTR